MVIPALLITILVDIAIQGTVQPTSINADILCVAECGGKHIAEATTYANGTFHCTLRFEASCSWVSISAYMGGIKLVGGEFLGPEGNFTFPLPPPINNTIPIAIDLGVVRPATWAELDVEKGRALVRVIGDAPVYVRLVVDGETTYRGYAEPGTQLEIPIGQGSHIIRLYLNDTLVTQLSTQAPSGTDTRIALILAITVALALAIIALRHRTKSF